MALHEEQDPSLVTTSLLVVSIVLPLLGTLAIALRFYASIVKTRRLYLDDWVAALAQLCAWGISIDVFVAAALGGVDHTTLNPLSAGVVFLRVRILPIGSIDDTR